MIPIDKTIKRTTDLASGSSCYTGLGTFAPGPEVAAGPEVTAAPEVAAGPEVTAGPEVAAGPEAAAGAEEESRTVLRKMSRAEGMSTAGSVTLNLMSA